MDSVHENEDSHNCRLCDKSFSHKCDSNTCWKVPEIGTNIKKSKSPSWNKSWFQTVEWNHQTIWIRRVQKPSKCLICYQSFSPNCQSKKYVYSAYENEDSHNCKSCDKSFFINVIQQHVENFMRLEQPYKIVKSQVAIRFVLKNMNQNNTKWHGS